MKKIVEVLVKALDILFIPLIVAYIVAVIRTEVLINEYDKGLPLLTGVLIVPFATIFTIVQWEECVKRLTSIGKYAGLEYVTPAKGIIGFIIWLPACLFFTAVTAFFALEATGIIPFGITF